MNDEATLKRKRFLDTRKSKIYATIGVVVAAIGSMLTLGALATFTSSATPTTPQAITSGTVVLQLGTDNTNANRMSIGATNIAAGDTISRVMDLSNAGTIDFSAVSLTTTAPVTTSLLDTDATNGLQMQIDKCSVAWTESGPPYTYTCGGSTTTPVASRAVIGSAISMGSGINTAGTTGHYLVTLNLPSATGNTFQGLASTIVYTFTGTQRTATSK